LATDWDADASVVVSVLVGYQFHGHLDCRWPDEGSSCGILLLLLLLLLLRLLPRWFAQLRPVRHRSAVEQRRSRELLEQ